MGIGIIATHPKWSGRRTHKEFESIVAAQPQPVRAVLEAVRADPEMVTWVRSIVKAVDQAQGEVQSLERMLADHSGGAI